MLFSAIFLPFYDGNTLILNHLLPLLLLCLLLPVALFLWNLWLSCLYTSPLSCPLTFSLSPLLLDFPLCKQPWGSQEARRVCGSRKSRAVAFPAFQHEISRRRSLSNVDRDPGGGETGCSSNHFRSHHFLQVDWTNVENPFFVCAHFFPPPISSAPLGEMNSCLLRPH